MRRFPNHKLRKRRMLTPCAVGFKWGVSCSSRGGGMGASVGGESILFSLSLFHVAFYFSLHPYPCIFHLSGARSTEKGWFPMVRGPQIREMEAQHLEAEGLEKIEVVVAGSEAEGFYGLLRGAMLHFSISPAPTPHKKVCHTPSAPSGVHRTWCPWSCGPGNEGCLSCCPSSFRGGHSCWYATPLYSAGGIKWVYQCQVEGCKEGPSTSCATNCAHVCKVHLGMGLVCPSSSKSFFNPDTFQCHKKSHFNQ